MPLLSLLTPSLVSQIKGEALGVLQDPGVRVHNVEGLKLLATAGARVDFDARVAFIPESLVYQALATAPHSFFLYTLEGKEAVQYGGDEVQFDPGSAAVAVLDSKTGKQRPPTTKDFVDFVKLVEVLPQLDAQSTAFVCSDVAEGIGDLYRLYLALNYMNKPIITGAFGKESYWVMVEMLVAAVGGEKNLREKPIAVFDVCPSPPLLWSDLTCQNLVDCARKGIPAELISMPLAGATSPVTLAAAVVKHTAESLSGIVIHQLANPGAPIVWGGAPATFDMREGTTPMGDVGTWMIDAAYVQVGKSYDLPTHTYMGSSDSKALDFQAGMESSAGTFLAALIGVNMVSGAGMIDFLRSQSLEKLVLDAEIIGMAKRLLRGIEIRDTPLALDLIRKSGHKADHLTRSHTRNWFTKELYIPTDIVDRGSLEAWTRKGERSSWQRAAERVEKLLNAYQGSSATQEMKNELRKIALSAAQKAGMQELPELP